MKISVESKDLITTESIYHFKIKLNDNLCLFIVETCNIKVLPIPIIKIKNVSGQRLKRSEKKLIKTTIESYFM